MSHSHARLISITAAVLLLAAMPAAGTVFQVTNLNDSGAGSLRQAVLDANANPGADSITFQSGLTGTIGLTSGEIAITDSVAIVGPGAPALAVTSTARIFNISGADTLSVTISGLTLTGANATGDGGAIHNTNVNVTLSFDTLSANTASGEGGAIFNQCSFGPNGSTFTINGSTLSGNHANKAGAIRSTGYHMVITDSTISGNHATDSVGGIKLENAFASIYNSTVSGNSANLGGGILLNQNYVLDLFSTIVAKNTDSTGASDLARNSNSTINASNSLIMQDLSLVLPTVINGTNTGNLIGVDPLLSPLTYNGGTTQTQALSPISQAVNAGSNPLALASDQRGTGFPRVVGGQADIGAYEVPPPPTIAKAFGGPTAPLAGSTTLTFTLTNPGASTVLTGVGFSDTLPPGLVVSTPNGLSSTCGGTATATAGSTSVSLAGGSLAAGGSCTLEVNVTGTTVGTKNNTSGAVTSTEGGTGATSNMATVTVVAPATLSKSFGAAIINFHETTSLTFVVTNPNLATPLTGVGFADIFPAGLVVATPNGLSGSCDAGTITAIPGTTTVALLNATLAANSSCTFSVNVTALGAGALVNTTGQMNSAEGGPGDPASATLIVLAPIPALSEWGLLALAALLGVAALLLLRRSR
ncbi:MAG: IPTL-CTERM sorting domain-containing protein [Thermoanaerobaculales bacterium]